MVFDNTPRRRANWQNVRPHAFDALLEPTTPVMRGRRNVTRVEDGEALYRRRRVRWL